jgi:hypothetical protein
MGKYRTSSRIVQKPKPESPHVIWRGIGCLLMLIIPAVSIAAAVETINYGLEHGWAIPYQLLGFVKLPDLFYKSDGVLFIFGPILRTQNFYAYAATSLIYMMVIGGIISFGYALIYRMIGPSRYGPTDAPPPKIKTKKYTR